MPTLNTTTYECGCKAEGIANPVRCINHGQPAKVHEVESLHPVNLATMEKNEARFRGDFESLMTEIEKLRARVRGLENDFFGIGVAGGRANAASPSKLPAPPTADPQQPPHSDPPFPTQPRQDQTAAQENLNAKGQ